MNYVIMGIDRIGKDSFINNNLNYCNITHLTKPPKNQDPLLFSKNQYLNYFINLKNNNNIVYNRGHIDEFVYAPLYRNYSTNYLTIMEQEFKFDVQSTAFILLYTTNFDIIIDDGLSLDFNRKEEEQERFLHFLNSSEMINKFSIQVNNGNKFKNHESISNEFNTLLNKTPYMQNILFPQKQPTIYFSQI